MHLIAQRTCEVLKESHANLFDLVNYAIEVARNIIETEREPKVKTEIRNPAYCALEEIANQVDVLEAKKEKSPEVAELQQPASSKQDKPKRKVFKSLRTIDR